MKRELDIKFEKNDYLMLVFIVVIAMMFASSSWVFWSATAKDQKCKKSCLVTGLPKSTRSGDQCFCVNELKSVEIKDWE